MKKITYRPLSEAGMQKMQEWLQTIDWTKETHGKNAHEAASHLMTVLRTKTEDFFPTKSRNISSINQPFYSENLAVLKRQKQREYNKNRKSEKWKKLNLKYTSKLNIAKKIYYTKEISKLKNANPKKWFYWLKRLISKDQAKEQELSVEEICHLSKEDQAEKIADSFSSISQEYDKVNPVSIKIPPFKQEDIPVISVKTVEKCLEEINISKAKTKNYIPAVIFKKNFKTIV